ncbi:MAG: TRM11 family SAM-dependent methyltransferase [Promethearchaeota archaeon]
MPGKKNNGKIELFDSSGNSRGFFDLRNQINNLTGKEWIFSTKSVIPKSFPPSFQHELRNHHGGQKPPELCELLIKTFTKEGELVLDPFAGVGGTLLGCFLSNRRGIGIEINKKWLDIYQEVCSREGIKPERTLQGDAKILLEKLIKDEKLHADFILTDVPYWKMDKVEKSKGTYKKVGKPAKGIYSDRSKLSRFNDVGSQETKEEWLENLAEVFQRCHEILVPGRYCAVFIGNMYHDGKYHLLNAEITSILKKKGFVLKGEIVWYDVAKKLHLYGINYSWIPSIVHQYIMIFRKERKKPINIEEKKAIIEKNKDYAKKHSREAGHDTRVN